MVGAVVVEMDEVVERVELALELAAAETAVKDLPSSSPTYVVKIAMVEFTVVESQYKACTLIGNICTRLQKGPSPTLVLLVFEPASDLLSLTI